MHGGNGRAMSIWQVAVKVLVLAASDCTRFRSVWGILLLSSMHANSAGMLMAVSTAEQWHPVTSGEGGCADNHAPGGTGHQLHPPTRHCAP